MKPILFNTEMVRAILDGRKTVTRRVVKPQPKYELRVEPEGRYHAGEWHEYSEEPVFDRRMGLANQWGCQYRPPYCPGDILYVRETFSPLYKDEVSDEIIGYMYKADTLEDYDREYPHGENYTWDGYWHPSIHMPKEAARIFLRVKGVSVERLQEITQDGARAEGVKDPYDDQAPEWYEQHGLVTNYEIDAFAGLWDSTVRKADLDKYGWEANPWCWVISFERISKEEALENES